MARGPHTPEAAKAASRARFKLLGSILTNYGYAVMGVAIIQPLLVDGPHELTVARRWAIFLALAFQGVALYIAPRGEKS